MDIDEKVELESFDDDKKVWVKIPKGKAVEVMESMKDDFKKSMQTFPRGMSLLEIGRLQAFINKCNEEIKNMSEVQWGFCQTLLAMQSVLFVRKPSSASKIKKIDKMAAYFSKWYCEKCTDRYCCITERGGEEKCYFQDVTGNCTVYDIRPMHCRTYFCENIDVETLNKILKAFQLSEMKVIDQRNIFEDAKEDP